MNTDDREIVSALRASLAERIGNHRYDVWFGPGTRLQLLDGVLQVTVPNRFFLDWLRRNFRGDLEDSCRGVLRETPRLEFRVGTADESADPSSEVRSPAIDPSEGNGASTLVAEPATSLVRAANRLSRPPNDAPRRRYASLEQFVQGPCNRLALTSAQLAIEAPGQHSPLLVYGPTSVGKSHLLEGMYRAYSRTGKQRAVLLSAEQFTAEFVDAVRGGGLPSFRAKYRGPDVLLIDDLQFFRGKKATIGELLHTIDTSLRAGKQLVIASDRPPADLPELGPELLTRLEGGLVCPILPPGPDVRLGIVRGLAVRHEVDLPEDVCRFVACQLTSHARCLAGAVNRLKATVMAESRPIDLPLAQAALADMIRHNAKPVQLVDIQRVVCDVFGVDAKALASTRKGRSVSHPRMLAMWLARKHTRAALSEIGHYFGRRSHSTVISAQRRVNSWMASGQALDLPEHHMTAEEAIRQLEERLRVG